MILKALTLENFKGIREPVRIEFAPLTLLFGPNNAGKSTIVQALMYAREVLEHRNCDAGRTQIGGEIIDLGGFENLVYGHDRNRAIRMRFELELPDGLSYYGDDWLRETQMDQLMDYTYKDAPKQISYIDVDTLYSWLKNVWVEFQVAWSPSSQAPVISSYSVGLKNNCYATLSYNDGINKTSLSHIDFGVFPFGVKFEKENLSDFDWEFLKAVQIFVLGLIGKKELKTLDISKGARLGMPEEKTGKSSWILPYDEFNKLVQNIIDGEGAWGDATVANETGEPNNNYKVRSSLIEKAEANVKKAAAKECRINSSPEDAERVLSMLVKLDPDNPAKKLHEIMTNIDPSHSEWGNWIEPLYRGDHQIAHGWLLDLFVAMICDDKIPLKPGNEMSLRLKHSALPDFNRSLELDKDVWKADENNEFWEYPAAVQEYLQDVLTVAIVKPGQQLLSALQETIYVSPFRAMPPRHYQPARSPDSRRWADGLAAWDWLILKGKPFVARVNDWLANSDRFDAGYELDLRHYRELELDSDLLNELSDPEDNLPLDRAKILKQLEQLPVGKRLQIKDCRHGTTLFPQDLGVGLSQLVPVIVAALHKENGIVAIEEPESNIHPGFQVVLADLFLSQTKRNSNVMFLVETHSEHLLLRCLRRIREVPEEKPNVNQLNISPEDIAVHFVEPDENGPRIHRIRIDNDGEFIDPWPRGFFRERIKELYGDDL